ncbi:MAG TPA: hypothetical protein VLM42_07955, partial [Bryobacteraceae bacterium]|nr:hypothetical protein [Bryobacteraceae bacterium]
MEPIIQTQRREMMRHPALYRWLVIAAVFHAAHMGAFAQRLSLGFIGGANLTHDFSTSSSQYVDPSYPNGLSSFVLFSDSHSLIVGPTVEVDFAKELSIEIDALHRNLELQNASIPPGGQRVTGSDPDEIGTWEFPFLLKYKIPASKIRPFMELGPSFRVRKNPNSTEPSSYGFAAGLGAEFRLGRFRLSPTIRYTRWADEPPFHVPVFVLTHRTLDSIDMSGGTTFHFVEATPHEVLAQATAVAG